MWLAEMSVLVALATFLLSPGYLETVCFRGQMRVARNMGTRQVSRKPPIQIPSIMSKALGSVCLLEKWVWDY